VVLDDRSAAQLQPPTEDEEDMLDLIPNCTPTSRLACQVTVVIQLEGMRVRIPGPSWRST
jgi:ferredoxin